MVGNKVAQAMQVIHRVRQQTDTVVLYYSAGGKDGIALLDMLAGVFSRVICVYMYLVPGLDHIRPYLAWAQRHYRNVEVREIPHFQLDIWKANGFFCEADPDIKPRNIGEVEEQVRQELGVHYAFSGMKGVDGYMKRMRLKTYEKRGGLITEKGMAYPLANWTNKDVLQYIRSRNLIQPFVYVEGDVSQGFDLSLGTMLLMKYRYPADYKRTLASFPYAEKILFDFCDGYIPKGQEKGVRSVLKSLRMEYLMPAEVKESEAVTAPSADDTPEEETE